MATTAITSPTLPQKPQFDIESQKPINTESRWGRVFRVFKTKVAPNIPNGTSLVCGLASLIGGAILYLSETTGTVASTVAKVALVAGVVGVGSSATSTAIVCCQSTDRQLSDNVEQLGVAAKSMEEGSDKIVSAAERAQQAAQILQGVGDAAQQRIQQRMITQEDHEREMAKITDRLTHALEEARRAQTVIEKFQTVSSQISGSIQEAVMTISDSQDQIGLAAIAAHQGFDAVVGMAKSSEAEQKDLMASIKVLEGQLKQIIDLITQLGIVIAKERESRIALEKAAAEGEKNARELDNLREKFKGLLTQIETLNGALESLQQLGSFKELLPKLLAKKDQILTLLEEP